MGWTELDNGALLKAAETDFDAFITTDQNLRYQQNLTGDNGWRFWCCPQRVGRRFTLMRRKLSPQSTRSVPGMS